MHKDKNMVALNINGHDNQRMHTAIKDAAKSLA